MKKRIIVWLSWWVDSAVTAYLLQNEGYEVVAGFMKNYVSDEWNCPTREDRDEAIRVAAFLGIKTFMICDFREEYNDKVVEYIFEWYKSWITPNPDILCNSEIKFKVFLERALEFGFDYIATGHYARINETKDGVFHLLKWVDPDKDQSYFLAGLNQFQLSKALFPIGWMLKSEVRKIAEEIGLPNAKRKDSQGICFIGKTQMQKFLEKKIETKKWDIINIKWEKLGEHEWAWFYTIGQRKWIKVWWWPALFVIKKDVEKNILVVWDEKEMELYSDSLIATQWHRIGNKINLPLNANFKIRYRQLDQEWVLTDLWNDRVEINFKNPQRAIASGQVVACYMEDELVGSGVIE